MDRGRDLIRRRRENKLTMIWPLSLLFPKRPTRSDNWIVQTILVEAIISSHQEEWLEIDGVFAIGITEYESLPAVYVLTEKPSLFPHKTGDTIVGCPIVVREDRPPVMG